jgi:hypothetical protein
MNLQGAKTAMRALNLDGGEGSGVKGHTTDRPTWSKTALGGYVHTFGAMLNKEGKGWVLTYRGQRVDLPRKASFDHAERAMGDIDGGRA